MAIGNIDEALHEVSMDIEEGADIMVKPECRSKSSKRRI